MDEKDLIIQRLRRDLNALEEFQDWLRDEAFGEEQYAMLMKAYAEDTRNGDIS